MRSRNGEMLSTEEYASVVSCSGCLAQSRVEHDFVSTKTMKRMQRARIVDKLAVAVCT